MQILLRLQTAKLVLNASALSPITNSSIHNRFIVVYVEGKDDDFSDNWVLSGTHLVSKEAVWLHWHQLFFKDEQEKF